MERSEGNLYNEISEEDSGEGEGGREKETGVVKTGPQVIGVLFGV